MIHCHNYGINRLANRLERYSSSYSIDHLGEKERLIGWKDIHLAIVLIIGVKKNERNGK